MKISVLIASYGDSLWDSLARARALPSTEGQGAHEVIQIHDPAATIAQARNRCAEEANGTHLVFLDADDELAPGYIVAMETVIACRPSHPPPTRTLFTPAVQQIRNGVTGKPLPTGEPFFYKECSLTTGNWLVIGTLIQRDLFWEIDGFHDHPHGLEDWNLWARAVRAGAEIVKVPDAVYVAHINPKSKHRELSRDRQAYRAAYAHAREDAWG